MQRGVNTREEKIGKWLDPNDPFRIKLMYFYYYRINFGEEEIPLTKDDVEAFYSDLRIEGLVSIDPTEDDLEAGVTMYNEDLVKDPEIQRLVRDQVRSQIREYGHGCNLIWKDDPK